MIVLEYECLGPQINCDANFLVIAQIGDAHFHQAQGTSVSIKIRKYLIRAQSTSNTAATFIFQGTFTNLKCTAGVVVYSKFRLYFLWT